jgi:hypothetical protein
MDLQVKPAGSVENDPTATLPSYSNERSKAQQTLPFAERPMDICIEIERTHNTISAMQWSKFPALRAEGRAKYGHGWKGDDGSNESYIQQV